MNLMPLFIVWVLLITVILCLAAWRKMVSSHEDDNIHMNQSVEKQQVELAQKLQVIDKWGKLFTIAAAAFAVLLLALYLYNGLVHPAPPAS